MSSAIPSPLRVLLLEDNPLDAELTLAALDEAGIHCTSQRVENGPQMEAALAKGELDVVLADFNLPGFSGLAGLDLFRRARLDVPFIFVSGALGEEQAVACLRSGATDYVLKTNLHRLAPVLERAFSERREQRRRSAAEMRYRLVTEAVFDAVWDWDVPADRIEWSQGLGTLFGYRLEDAGGRGDWWLERVHPDERAAIEQGVYAAINGSGSIWEAEYRFRRADGTYASVIDRAYLQRNEAGRAVRLVGAMMDITDRKRAESELRQLTADLEQRVARRTAELEASNRELEAFTYAVSHDLRAPLRAIESFGAALLEDCGERLDDTGRRHLERIRRAGRRMSRLVDDLLILSRVTRQPMQQEEVDLSALAQGVVEELRGNEPQRQVDFDIAPNLRVIGDPGLLRVALVNLFANAWKYTSRHPHATITLGSEEVAGVTAYFVRDDGAGFDPRYADRLFLPFQRLHSASQFEGNGVGLATVRRVIERHGGRIWAVGAVEQGATFWFSLS
jgi:PAS domain S-box-containing protein